MSRPANSTASATSLPPSAPMAISSNGAQKHILIYDLPHSQRQRLCDHLDDLNVWNQLANDMRLKPAEMQKIRRKQTVHGNSPMDELLKIWGGQYNHTVTELYVVLHRQKLYEAMRILKDFVAHKYHLLIPSSQPVISVLLDSKTKHSKNIINGGHSSGISDSNDVDTSDNNRSSNASISDLQPEQQESKQSNTPSRHLRVKEYTSYIPAYDYAELTKATQNWSADNILGKGGFGTVYQGYLKYTAVAIKQIDYRGTQGHESGKVQLQQSVNELKYLNSWRHDNVLPLYGYCIKGEKPCLVYQLMAGGSLEDHLNVNNKKVPLTWEQRISICLGTARGINFLHTFRKKPLIHGDIKPANVLLDQCLQPKIGDFGLAREGPSAVNSAIEVTQVFGTKPYLPPEFLNSKKLSTQVDTYSFGVVLLEVFTGLRVYDKHRAQPLLAAHLLSVCAAIPPENRLKNLIYKGIKAQAAEPDMCLSSIELGLCCIANTAQNRPEMEEVLKALSVSYNRCYLMPVVKKAESNKEEDK